MNVDAYDYDKSLFYRLLESTTTYKSKYDLVQEKEGLIVIPLEFSSANLSKLKAKERVELIDMHLYLPSPFYKNRYIPLNSLTALANLNLSTNSMSSSFLLDHTQQIYLSLSEDSSNEFTLMYQSQQICKYVKLLGIQTNYNENQQPYKILIVDKPIYFRLSLNRKPSINKQVVNNDIIWNMNDIDAQQSINEDDEDDLPLVDAQNGNSVYDSPKKKKHQTKTLISFDMNESNEKHARKKSLNEVKKFSHSIDFMHEFRDLSEDAHIGSPFIGEDLLKELELFRKTYIILHTHLDDCAKRLQGIYLKYIKLFLRSLKQSDRDQIEGDADLLVSIACENVINGYLHPKIWPSILKMNSDDDEMILGKCKQMANYLKLNSNDYLIACSTYFQLPEFFFTISYASVLREIGKLSFINNPFEKLECIKTSIDIVNNEITISTLAAQSSTQTNDTTQAIITTDMLIPLIAFVLIKSNINCLKSILYFIDTFAFASHPNKYSTASSSSLLAELFFFFSTFKAAIQLIETSEFSI